MSESPSKDRIRSNTLDKNIPQNSALREYLAGKDETGFAAPKRAPKLAAIGRSRETFPKTLLLMPPITLSEGTVKRVIPPLGLAYIGGYLESQGIPFDILDCVVEGLDQERLVGPKTWEYGLSYEQIEEYLATYKPDILGISIIYSSDLRCMYNIAAIAKKVNPRMTVISGGIHCSIYPQEVLTESNVDGTPTIDYVIRGEGEMRLAEFIRNYMNGVADLTADGLCGWHDGELFLNPQVETIQDLDALPYPAYHRLPMEKYFAFNVPFSPFPRGKRVMQLYTSRGCPVGCTFCASTNFNKAFRAISPENVIKEIKYYQETFAIDEIQFADDNLTFNRARSMELFERLAECGLQWCTPNGTMINTLTEDMLEKMIQSGLYQITLSLDSGSAKTLKEFHRKPVKLELMPEFAAYLKQRGILIHVTLVVGMPGETLEQIQEGFQFVEQLNIDSIGVFLAQALPGSELYESALERGQITKLKARIIDTTQNNINLSNIPKAVLEQTVSDFLYRYNKVMKDRDPIAWQKKYASHQHRMSTICIGKSAPNTDGIIKAAEPTPTELYF